MAKRDKKYLDYDFNKLGDSYYDYCSPHGAE